ncbi:MAG TPA: hypothetical protein DIT25_02685 [Candidatus Moranbacteria bacterium]|nr:hypothetical protein [Candidatus Moranbacteria bacterium]
MSAKKKNFLKGPTYDPRAGGKFRRNGGGLFGRKQATLDRLKTENERFPRNPIRDGETDASEKRSHGKKIIGLSKIYYDIFARCLNCKAKNVVKKEGMVKCSKCGTQFKAAKTA